MSDASTQPAADAASPGTPAGDDPKAADARLRQRVAQRLARAPAQGQGQVTLADGRTLGYRIDARFVPVLAAGFDAQAGEPQAAVFTTAYLADPPTPDGRAAAAPGAAASAGAAGATGSAPRPVCFVFNGGPGSASVWLHLGAVGPQRVPVPDDGGMPAAPYRLEPNPHTWLAHFDLVFIDPPHTGWSICASAAARKQMLSVDGDVAALTEVVRAWLAATGRFGAPVYLAGESYGTTRAAAMAEALIDAGIGPEGVVLVSCAMDLQSIVFSPRNDLPFALFLPGFAHVAQFHGRLKGELGASAATARAEAEDFAAGEYLGALHAGARLDLRQRRRIARRLGELTGLNPVLVEDSNLRISDQAFFAELLRDQGRVVGRLDGRCTAPMGARRGRTMEFDPGMDGITLAYSTALMAQAQQLGLPLAERYETLSMDVNNAWRWQRKPPGRDAGAGDDEGMGFCSTGDDLARALRRHPGLRVLVASGRADLGTPYSASDWSLAQLDAPPEVLARITHHHYDGGHMMYTRREDLAALQRDLAAWLAAPASTPAS